MRGAPLELLCILGALERLVVVVVTARDRPELPDRAAGKAKANDKLEGAVGEGAMLGRLRPVRHRVDLRARAGGVQGVREAIKRAEGFSRAAARPFCRGPA